MPQLTINPYEVAAAIRLGVQLNVDKPGGVVTVVIEDQRGLPIARANKRWTAERDLAGLPRLAGDMLDLFLWGDPRRSDLALAVAFRDWMPSVQQAHRAHARRRDQE